MLYCCLARVLIIQSSFLLLLFKAAIFCRLNKSPTRQQLQPVSVARLTAVHSQSWQVKSKDRIACPNRKTQISSTSFLFNVIFLYFSCSRTADILPHVRAVQPFLFYVYKHIFFSCFPIGRNKNKTIPWQDPSVHKTDHQASLKK